MLFGGRSNGAPLRSGVPLRSTSWRDPRQERRQRGVQILSESRNMCTKAFSSTVKPGPKRLPLIQNKPRTSRILRNKRSKDSREMVPSENRMSKTRAAAQRSTHRRRRVKGSTQSLARSSDGGQEKTKTSLRIMLPKIHEKLIKSSGLLSQTLIHKHLLACTKRRMQSSKSQSPVESNSPLLSPESPYRRQKSSLTTQRGFQSYRKRLQVTPLKKIGNNIQMFKGTGREPVVLVCVGAFNPAHLNNLRIFHLAKQHLELTKNMAVVGGLVCPSHDKFVLTKCRGRAYEAIPAQHRVRILEILFASSSWIDVDRWEVTRKCGFLDYPTVLQHVQTLVARTFGPQVKVMCLCGPTKLLRLTPDILREHKAICVTRRGYIQGMVEKMASKWPGSIEICVDDDIIPISLANATSARIRKRLGRGDLNVQDMTGDDVQRYIYENRIADKISNRLPWTTLDRETRALVRPQTFLAELDHVTAEVI